MQLKLDGYFFECVKQLNHYSEEEIEVMQRTKAQLKAHSTDTFRPGMLLGRIQSGKTRSYIGMMALALDDVFDCIVILRKIPMHLHVRRMSVSLVSFDARWMRIWSLCMILSVCRSCANMN